MILLPEQRLKFALDFFLKQLTPEYLHDLFGTQEFGQGYNYFENAVALFLRDNDNPRKVSSNIFFNRDRQGLPTIHIALNQDMLGEGNGLGFDLGTEVDRDGFYRTTTSRVYSSRFNIICTSDNTFEVLIMYNVIRALFQGNVQVLEWLGLSNAKFSGQDLILSDYLMPATIYARGFIVDCIYEEETVGLALQEGVRECFVSSICGKEVNVLD